MMGIHEHGFAEAAKFRRDLEGWLRHVEKSDENATALLHHLGDIRFSCEKVASLLASLPKSDLSTSAGREQLALLYGELFEHLAKHIADSKLIVHALLRRAYRAAEERGEL